MREGRRKVCLLLNGGLVTPLNVSNPWCEVPGYKKLNLPPLSPYINNQLRSQLFDFCAPEVEARAYAYQDSTLHAISYWCSIGTEHLSPSVFEIFGSKHIWVTTLTFWGSRDVIGHVTI